MINPLEYINRVQYPCLPHKPPQLPHLIVGKMASVCASSAIAAVAISSPRQALSFPYYYQPIFEQYKPMLFRIKVSVGISKYVPT